MTGIPLSRRFARSVRANGCGVRAQIWLRCGAPSGGHRVDLTPVAPSLWGMSPSHARRLKELEVENARLKKLLAEAELDKAMLKELAEGKW